MVEECEMVITEVKQIDTSIIMSNTNEYGSKI